MLPRLVVCALAIATLAPVAAAFSSTQGEVGISYPQGSAPPLVAAGKLEASGIVADGLLAGFLDESRASRIPTLTILDTRGTPSANVVPSATLVIHSGHLAWRMEGGSATMTSNASYAFALALPQSPFAAEGSDAPALVLAGPSVGGVVGWTRGSAALVPLNATVTVLDGSGKPVAGFDRVRINENASLEDAEREGRGIVFDATGPFDFRFSSRALVAGMDASRATMRVDVRSSPEDRFLDAAEAVQDTMAIVSGPAEGPDAAALSQLAPFSGFFNGAVLILPADGNATAAPTEARLAEGELDTGAFTMLRSESLALSWGDGETRIDGRSTLAITRQGFAVDSVVAAGPVPIVAILLWLGAIGASVLFFMKRPPKSTGKWPIRIACWGVYAVVLALAFWWWDVKFAETFGTSLLTLLSQGGAEYQQLTTVFGVQMIPWSLAALLFALPVRIAAGVALRYRGEGSSYKALAKAGGLVSLALLGPIYALWIVNVLVAFLVERLGAIFA